MFYKLTFQLTEFEPNLIGQVFKLQYRLTANINPAALYLDCF